MADFITGLRYALSGFSLIGRPGIRVFVLIPLLINTILFALAIYYGTTLFNQTLQQLTHQWAWLEWLTWLLWPIFLVLMLGFIFFCFTLFANLFASPFNGRLAASVEESLTGVKPATSSPATGIFAEFLKGLRSEAIKMRYFLLRGLPLSILFVVPVIQLIAPLLWFIYAVWMIALEYLEIPLSNQGLLFPQVCSLAGANRMKVLGLGTGILVLTLIPGVNLLVMPVAVSAATKMAVVELTASAKN